MIKFQYNKTSLGELGKQLKIRTRALPTLKNKEAALRLEVKKAKRRSDELLEELSAALERYSYLSGLWNEFEPGLISVRDVELVTAKFAGVRIPELKDVIYDVREFNLFQKPLWYSDGVQILKDLARLDFSRKKTTQKVNLYEKVQIPGYNEAILKIKRYLEDEENLSKASQKIVKNRHDLEAEEEAL